MYFLVCFVVSLRSSNESSGIAEKTLDWVRITNSVLEANSYWVLTLCHLRHLMPSSYLIFIKTLWHRWFALYTCGSWLLCWVAWDVWWGACGDRAEPAPYGNTADSAWSRAVEMLTHHLTGKDINLLFGNHGDLGNIVYHSAQANALKKTFP